MSAAFRSLLGSVAAGLVRRVIASAGKTHEARLVVVSRRRRAIHAKSVCVVEPSDGSGVDSRAAHRAALQFEAEGL